MSRKIFPVFFILVLILVTSLLNIPLQDYYWSQAGPAAQNIIYRMFGGLRGLLADWAFMKGEEYFHGGLPVRAMDASKCLELELRESREGNTEEHGHEEEHRHETEQHRKPDLYSRLYSLVKVVEHTHLPHSEEKEVLPWFYLQVRFNPHDIQGYELGAYWLKRLGKYEEGMKFLKEGERNNPESAQIKTSIGEFLIQAQNYEAAIPYLERARTLWQEGKAPNLVRDDYTRMDRNLTYSLLGKAYEYTGQYSRASSVYRELITLEPDRARPLMERIKKLGTGSSG